MHKVSLFIVLIIIIVKSQTPSDPSPEEPITETSLPYAPKPLPAHCVGNQRDYLTASLLSILLGGLGVDRFYMGYILTGMIKMTIGLVVLSLTTIRVVYSFLVDTRKLQSPFKRMWISFVFFVFTCSTLQFILWIVDVIVIMSGAIADSNGCILAY
jgi:TM2 domain-containing membrane protein YozV